MRLSWIAAPSIAAAMAAGALTPATPAADASVRTDTLRAVNKERAKHGLKKVRRSSKLARSAKAHSRKMVAHNAFTHNVAGEASLLKRVRRTGYGGGRWKAGEILAWGAGSRAKPKAIVRAWMHSSEHRRIILTRGFRSAGTGVVGETPSGGSGRTYTMHFGSE
jgi:uncharacterized protein YkwD